jgi:hypothetical protein
MGIVPVDRSIKTESEASPYLASRNVLPAQVTTLSKDFGSMWKNSVIQTPNNLIYGVDTVSKKIWRTNGQNVELISDHHVTKFLNDFVDLSEFDYRAYQGHLDVKTHYNNFKHDVIFTLVKDAPVYKLPAEGNNNLIEDTYYRVNEEKALALMDNEFTFVKKFDYHKNEQKVLLVCEGIDTLCDLYINDKFLAHTDNMHRNYEFDISSFLIDGINQIKAVFPPLDKFIKKKYKNKVINGCSHPLNGFMYVRKAHYMLGWDWGPRTPDAGIWKPIYLLEGEQPRIKDVVIEQRH